MFYYLSKLSSMQPRFKVFAKRLTVAGLWDNKQSWTI